MNISQELNRRKRPRKIPNPPKMQISPTTEWVIFVEYLFWSNLKISNIEIIPIRSPFIAKTNIRIRLNHCMP